MVSAAHMLGGSWACSLREFLKKKCSSLRFYHDVFLHTILAPPQTSSFACYMRHHSGPFLSFLAYYMGAPSDQFIHLLWGPRSLCLFFILYGGPSDHFFAYYIGAPRSLSLLTIWGPSYQLLLIQYGSRSQISFIVYYMGPPPLRSVSLHAIGEGATTDFSFFTKYMGAPSDQFLRLLYEVPSDQFCAYFLGAPLRLVFSLTIWGPH